jgi:hypothetical protein
MHYKKTVARRVAAWVRAKRSGVASMLAVLSYLGGMLIGIFAEKYAGGWLLIWSAFYFSWLSMRTAPPIEPKVEGYATFDRMAVARSYRNEEDAAWMDGPWDREATVHNSVSGKVDGSVTQIGHDYR